MNGFAHVEIKAQEVLSLHPEYFRLRKPLERRVYELSRKHCGQQATWSITLPVLLKKSGSQSPLKRFRQMIRHLVLHDHLPDYHVEFDAKADMVTFRNRGTMFPAATPVWSGHLDPETYHAARQAAPGWDIHHLEAEWRDWIIEAPKYPDKAFIGFCCNGLDDNCTSLCS